MAPSKLPTTKGKKKFYDETSDHIVQTFGGLVPITASDNLSKAPAWSGLIDGPSGCILFTAGRNMYMWSIKTDQKPMKKFLIPASELATLGRHVSIAVFPKSVSLTCVTPAGSVRYWKSLSNPNGSADFQLSLKGQEAHSILQLTYEKLVIATASCVLYFVDTASFDNRELNLTAKSKFSRLSSVASYFLPASNIAETTEEIRRMLVPLKSEELIFVVSNTSIYCVNFITEKLLWKNSLIQNQGTYILDSCYGQDGTKVIYENYDIKVLDARFWSDESEIILCIATRNLCDEPGNQMSCKISFMLLQNNQSSSGTDHCDINIFPSKLTLPVPFSTEGLSDENSFELEIPSSKYCDCFLRSKTQIVHISSMFMQNSEEVKIDIFELSKTNDSVVASGCIDDQFIFLTSKKGLVSYGSKNSKHLREFQSVSTLQQTLKDIYENYATEPFKQLLQYFLLYTKAKSSQKRLIALCENYFGELTSRNDFDYVIYNCAVSIIEGTYNDVSEFEDENETVDLNITASLEQKYELMVRFPEFLTAACLDKKLKTIERPSKIEEINTTTVPTIVAVFTLLEFVTCAQAFYDLHCKHEDFFEPFIRLVMENRSAKSLPSDYVIKFYKSVAGIEDIFSTIALAQRIGTVEPNFECAFVIVELFKEVFNRTSHCRETIGGPVGETKKHCYWNMTDEFMSYVLTHLNWVKHCPDILQNSTIAMELVQAHFDFGVVCLQSLSIFFRSLKNDGNNELGIYIENQVAKMRSAFINFFFEVKQPMHALALAEKFLDFETLIRTCVSEKKFDKLLHYQNVFASENFDLYLIKWLHANNYIKLLLSLKSPALLPFLNKTPELRWIVEAKDRNWAQAAVCLHRICSTDAEMKLHKKRLLLSYAKMYCMMAGNKSELMDDVSKMMNLLQLQVRFVRYTFGKLVILEKFDLTITNQYLILGCGGGGAFLNDGTCLIPYFSPARLIGVVSSFSHSLRIFYLPSLHPKCILCQKFKIRVVWYVAYQKQCSDHN